MYSFLNFKALRQGTCRQAGEGPEKPGAHMAVYKSDVNHLAIPGNHLLGRTIQLL